MKLNHRARRSRLEKWLTSQGLGDAHDDVYTSLGIATHAIALTRLRL